MSLLLLFLDLSYVYHNIYRLLCNILIEMTCIFFIHRYNMSYNLIKVILENNFKFRNLLLNTVE